MRKAVQAATRGVVLAGLSLLIAVSPSPAEAQRDGRQPEVLVETLFASLATEVYTSLGIGWGSIDGSYSSTGGQPPGDGTGSGAFGTFGVGGNLWLNTGVGQTSGGAISTGPLFLGVGTGVTGFFDSSRTVLEKSRHHPTTHQIDVVGSQSMNWAVDLTARGNVTLSFAPRVTPENSIRLELFAGVSALETETSLRTDQRFFGGADATKRSTDVDVVPLLGGAVSKEITRIKIPALGEIPVLGQIFVASRRVPGTEVSKPSPAGTEKFKTDAHWDTEAGVRLILFITPQIVR